MTALLSTGAQGGYYAITTWLPTFLRTERKLTVLGTSGYLSVIIIGSFIGYITSAYLSDHLGRRMNFFMSAGARRSRRASADKPSSATWYDRRFLPLHPL